MVLSDVAERRLVVARILHHTGEEREFKFLPMGISHFMKTNLYDKPGWYVEGLLLDGRMTGFPVANLLSWKDA